MICNGTHRGVLLLIQSFYLSVCSGATKREGSRTPAHPILETPFWLLSVIIVFITAIFVERSIITQEWSLNQGNKELMFKFTCLSTVSRLQTLAYMPYIRRLFYSSNIQCRLNSFFPLQFIHLDTGESDVSIGNHSGREYIHDIEKWYVELYAVLSYLVYHEIFNIITFARTFKKSLLGLYYPSK